MRPGGYGPVWQDGMEIDPRVLKFNLFTIETVTLPVSTNINTSGIEEYYSVISNTESNNAGYVSTINSIFIRYSPK